MAWWRGGEGSDRKVWEGAGWERMTWWGSGRVDSQDAPTTLHSVDIHDTIQYLFTPSNRRAFI